MELFDLPEENLRPDNPRSLCQLSCGVLVRHCSKRCSAVTNCPLLLFSTTALPSDIGSEAQAVRRIMAKKGELMPPRIPAQLQILSMPSDNCKQVGEEEDSGAESESEWETEEEEEEEEEEGQSSDSGLGSQGSGHCPRQSRESKLSSKDLDRSPYDPSPLASFTSVEVEVGQRCREWVTKITDPASRVRLLFILIIFC